MKLNLSALLAAIVLLVPNTGHSADIALFPDYQTAKSAYKAKDYTTAAQHWMPLAHKGHSKAQVELGNLYANGFGVRQNYNTAFNLFIAAAEQDNARSMFEIGRLYEKGRGVDKDLQKSKEWYQLAAMNGYARGNYAIGQMYEKNKFNTPNPVNKEVKENIRVSINNIKGGNFTAAPYLAAVYERGAGVPVNNTKALTYALLAQKTGQSFPSSKIEYLKSKVSLDNYLYANESSDLLLASQNKEVRPQRKKLIQSLKKVRTPEITQSQRVENKTKSLQYYEQAADQGYQRGIEKVAQINNEEAPIKAVKTTNNNPYRIVTELKTQFVGEENLDLGTRDNDLETSVILNGQIGVYLYPKDNVTTYVQARGLHSTGVASSNNDDDDDTSNSSFIELRQAWVEFESLFGASPLALKLGRQRFYETRGLWWNRDLDAVKLSTKSDITNGFIAVGENQDKYRIGEDNNLERDEEDRLRILGELSHQYAANQFIEGRFLYENDHSETGIIDQNIQENDRDSEDFNLLWAGARIKGAQQTNGVLNHIGYRADLIGVAGETTNTSTTTGPTPDLRTINGIDDRNVMAWAFDGSVDFEFDNTIQPTVTLGYAYGSGDDGNGTDNAFRQSDLDGNTSRFPENRVSSALRNYGEVLRPELSNIHIANAGLNIPIMRTSDVNFNYYAYWLGNELTPLRSNGLSANTNGQDNFLGQAIDISTNINIGKEMKLTNSILENSAIRIKLGGFQAGTAYGIADDEYAYRGSTEFRVKF